ncbi:hypothetical protein ACFX14_000666 [Malus domestica]
MESPLLSTTETSKVTVEHDGVLAAVVQMMESAMEDMVWFEDSPWALGEDPIPGKIEGIKMVDKEQGAFVTDSKCGMEVSGVEYISSLG